MSAGETEAADWLSQLFQASRARSHWMRCRSFLVADLLAEVFFERGQEVEGDVGGLEFLGRRG